ncbi:MAG: PKD domain-containing protein, partial [Thermoplasmata archaeon]|nr:PKD domain-containing protein [Thermoplasmata archaeon]
NPTPPPRLAGSMVYDPDLGGVVLFGGYNNSVPSGTSLLNDLWLYKAGAWSKLPDQSPPPARTWASLGFDPGLHELVLYGGYSPTSACYGDTWTYNGNWTHVAVPPGGPMGLTGTAMAYDPSLGQILLTGGANCALTNNTATWTFNGTAWQSLTTSGSPAPHLYGIAVWDPAAGVFVVAGDNLGPGYTDVLSSPFSLLNATGPSSSEVGQVVRFVASVTGGVPARSFAWDWGDGSSGAVTENATHPYAHSGTFPVHFRAVDATGASVYWNGSVQVSPSVSPVIAASATIADVGLNITFVASSSGGTGSATYSWNLGDGGTASGASVTHAFTAPGIFTVALTATDSVGGRGTATQAVDVFSTLTVTLAAPANADLGVSVHLLATAGGGAAPLSYSWILDDGAHGTAPVLDHA